MLVIGAEQHLLPMLELMAGKTVGFFSPDLKRLRMGFDPFYRGGCGQMCSEYLEMQQSQRAGLCEQGGPGTGMKPGSGSGCLWEAFPCSVSLLSQGPWWMELGMLSLSRWSFVQAAGSRFWEQPQGCLGSSCVGALM